MPLSFNDDSAYLAANLIVTAVSLKSQGHSLSYLIGDLYTAKEKLNAMKHLTK